MTKTNSISSSPGISVKQCGGCDIPDTGFDHAPHLDAGNQPDLDDSGPTAREDTRPDFQWELKDEHARTREEYQGFYAMECKRLGSPSSASWVLNKQYVTDGIRRFLKPEHSYGSPKSNRSASMIGYVQTMDFRSILEEVNHYCHVNGVTQIKLSENGWQNDPSFLRQVLHRPEIHPLALLLRHMWLDLRSVPINPIKTKPKKTRRKTGGTRAKKTSL